MKTTASLTQIPGSLPEIIDKIMLDEVSKSVNHVKLVYIEARASGRFLGSWRFRGDWPLLWTPAMQELQDRGVQSVGEIQLNIERIVDEDVLQNVGAFFDAAHVVFPGAYTRVCGVSAYIQRPRRFGVISGGPSNTASLQKRAA